jgi:hypothetical protein
MFKLLTPMFVFLLLGAPALQAQAPATVETRQPQQAQEEKASLTAPAPLPVMREYRGVKLGNTREEVKAAIGRAERAENSWEEYKLDSGDLITVHYNDKGIVKTIQLYFSHPTHAPTWTEVVGNAEIQQGPTGSKYARVGISEEDFWVTMFQSKSGAVTTITLSR